jgi:hypothetical protein
MKLIFIILLITSTSYAEIFKKGWGYKPFGKYLGSTLAINPDKSFVSIYFDMKKRKPVDLANKKELDLYKELLYKSLLPSFMLFELTYYPLTDLGGYIFKKKRSTYDKLGFTSPKIASRGRVEFNLINAMAARYETPYSFTLFLGDLIPFLVKPKEATPPPAQLEEKEKSRFLKGKMQVGSALMGFAFTFGQRRMKLMQILDDNWYYLAWKVRGSRKTKTKKMAWRYEVGYLHHSNKEFINAISFSAMRNKAIIGEKHFSLLNNSKIEYSFHIPLEKISKGKDSSDSKLDSEVKDESFDITRYTTFQKVVVGANFPLKDTFVLTTEIGFKWQAIKDLKKERPGNEFSIIFVPGLMW